MITGSPVAALARVAKVIIISTGIVVSGLVAVAATARFGTLLDAAWADVPGVIGLRGLAVTAAYLALGVALVLGIRRMGATALRRWVPWAPLLLLVGLRAAAIPLVETPLPPDNDPFFLHELAVEVLAGENWLVRHRPMGFSTMLAALYAVFGVHPWLAEALNLALAAVAGWMLHWFVRGGWGPVTAAMAVAIYAVVPSQVLLVTTIFTETLYSALLMTAIALAAGAMHSRRIATSVAAGALLGFSQYVRPLSQAFLATFIALPFLSGLRLARAAIAAAAITISFLIVLAPIAVHNAVTHGDLSLSTSSYGGWSVFVGTNQEHDGMFNRDDQSILRAMDGSIWENSEILGRAGIQRIVDDPRGFADLAIRKFRILWGDDTYAVGAALSGSSASDPIRSALVMTSQAIYTAIAVAAAIGLWRVRRSAPPEALILAGVLITMAAAHTFIEVQPRYHAYALPLLCALAAVAAMRMSDGADSSGDQRQVPG